MVLEMPNTRAPTTVQQLALLKVVLLLNGKLHIMAVRQVRLAQAAISVFSATSATRRINIERSHSA
jgi:hypothetical protein